MLDEGLKEINKKENKMPKKPPSQAQKNAMERNWNKGQMLCMISIAKRTINSKTTNGMEKVLLRSIIVAVERIIQYWEGK